MSREEQGGARKRSMEEEEEEMMDLVVVAPGESCAPPHPPGNVPPGPAYRALGTRPTTTLLKFLLFFETGSSEHLSSDLENN